MPEPLPSLPSRIAALLFRMKYPLLLIAGGVALADRAGLDIVNVGLWMGLGVFAGWWAKKKKDGWHEETFADWLDRLRNDPAEPSPDGLDGPRREAAERTERLLRKQRREREETESGLVNLQAALQATPNGVIILNEQNGIEWLNHSACKHFGLDNERDILQRITHLLRVPVLVRSLDERNFDEAIILESPLSTASYPLRLEVRFFPYGHDRLLMLSRDITVIEHAEAMRRDFVANVSHEIRTPLTVLSGFIETLQTLKISEDERKDYLLRMATQAGRMENLVDDLLMLSRLEGSDPPDAREWTAARTLFARIESDAYALSARVTGQNAPGHTLVFTGMDTKVEIAGATGELQSAFFNLVNNAIRYTPHGGRIVIQWLIEP
ncbi:MAG: PAS domain-containing protein, partial [Zoogloeaceae bacterium]|nr:PAS domain-containing protein [Zoogloeaceae bacterium]